MAVTAITITRPQIQHYREIHFRSFLHKRRSAATLQTTRQILPQKAVRTDELYRETKLTDPTGGISYITL